jgi:hypothetical protein
MLQIAINNLQDNKAVLKFNGENQLLAYADDVNSLGKTNTRKNRNST